MLINFVYHLFFYRTKSNQSRRLSSIGFGNRTESNSQKSSSSIMFDCRTNRTLIERLGSIGFDWFLVRFRSISYVGSFETDKFIVSPLIQKLWQVCTTPVARKTHEHAFSLPLCRSVFGQSTFSVASLVFMKGTSFCGIGRILSRVEPLTSWCAKFYRFAWFPLLFARHLEEFDTSVICHVFTLCLGSFLI